MESSHKKLALVGFLVVALVAVLTASPQAAPSSRLVAGIAQDISGLDNRKEGSAARFTLLRHIYEPLVWFDDSMKLYPVLAVSWQQVNPTTMRFKLRQNVKFQNGKPFTAQAVKYSLEKALDPKADVWMNFAVDGVLKSVSVIDDYTVDIVTAGPTPSLLWRLTLLDIVEPAYGETPAMDTTPMGTGPYKFVEFIPRQHLVMERNQSYWGPQGKLERIEVRILPEDGTRVAALLAGEVQMINAVSPEMIKRIKQSANATISTAPTARLIYVALRNDRPPLNDIKVRQALNYAVDKNAIVNTILTGIAQVAKSPLPPSLQSARTDLAYAYDPQKAKQLLAAGGYNGQAIKFAVGRGRYPNDGQVAEAIVNYLQGAGVKVDFQQGDWASMSAQARKGKDSPFDAFMQGWSADALDPVLMLDFLFNSRNTASRTAYADPKVDDLIAKATRTIDRKELDGLLKQIQGMVWEDAPFIFLYVPAEVLGISKNLKGFTARPDEFFFFTKAYLSQ